MAHAEEGTQQPIEVELRADCAVSLEKCCAKYPRARDVFHGLKWRLERQPDAGALLNLRDPESKCDGETRIIKSKLTPHLPTVTMIYRHEGDCVRIIRLHVSQPGRDSIL